MGAGAAGRLNGAAIGRRIPRDELARFDASLATTVAVYEPAAHVMFSGDERTTGMFSPPHERGNHGFWPLREDYRSVVVLAGPGISARRLPEASMLTIASRLARGLEIPFTPSAR